MRIILRVTLAIVLLTAGFATGFPIGQSIGITKGSEWVFVQADMLAREAGVFMPIHYENGIFRVTVKQPKHLYKRAKQLADKQPDIMPTINIAERSLLERIVASRSVYPTQ
jgi:hypothetical protein